MPINVFGLSLFIHLFILEHMEHINLATLFLPLNISEAYLEPFKHLWWSFSAKNVTTLSF